MASEPRRFSPRWLQQERTEVCHRLCRQEGAACPQRCRDGSGAYLQPGLVWVLPSQAVQLEHGGVCAPSPQRGRGRDLCPPVYRDGSRTAPAPHLCSWPCPLGPGFQVPPAGGSAPQVCRYLGNPALLVPQSGSEVGSRADRYTGGACLEHRQRDGAFLELCQLPSLHNLCFQNEDLLAFSGTERTLAARTRLTLGLACAPRFSEEEEG